MTREGETREKIVLSALALFSTRGIRQTSVNEIAHRAGVTRVTVYRHFPDKKALVLAAFLRVEQVFENGLADLKQNLRADWGSALNQIGQGLSKLPPGDVFARTDELKRIYPDVYKTVQEVRVVTLDGLFEHFFAVAKRHGVLRPGLNREIVQAVFWEMTINLFDNPRFQSLRLADAELYLAITDLFLHGVLKSSSVGN